MHILFITPDDRYLEETSEQRELLKMMSDVSESLHVVVFAKRSRGFQNQKLNEHTWIYPTNSFFRFLFYIDGRSVIRHQVLWQDELHADVILSDDAGMAGWLGLSVAARYGRVWMVALHDFYWDIEPSLWRLFRRYTVVPLKDLFKNAFRIITFSERVTIYTQHAASTDEERSKILPFPEIYVAPRVGTTTDIKQRYPEFNFIVLHYVPRGSGTLGLMLESMSMLRQTYPKSGLVVMLDRAPTLGQRTEVERWRAQSWIRFEVVPLGSLPFTNANAFLYLNGGEAEDTMLVRVVATGLAPVIATHSVVSERLLNNNVNGFLVSRPTADTIVSAIRTMNETPGMRELFRVNAGLLLQKQIIPTREAVTARLKECLSFEYQEVPEGMPGTERHLFAHLTRQLSFTERVRARLVKIVDHYTKP